MLSNGASVAKDGSITLHVGLRKQKQWEELIARRGFGTLSIGVRGGQVTLVKLEETETFDGPHR